MGMGLRKDLEGSNRNSSVDAVRRRLPHRRTRSPHSSAVPINTAVLFRQLRSWPYFLDSTVA
ncbi:hypothetical protein MUK42_37615 [Musa troglodytarum]|uniref:Uncharacterized protein n=1 Tax=Musa troglodytarum TaxID=320322 RepID=A0A9E7FLN8_9LILI|nr:hypothetical protein MUK42_37615 [Musa troglodytarum]